MFGPARPVYLTSLPQRLVFVGLAAFVQTSVAAVCGRSQIKTVAECEPAKSNVQRSAAS